MVLFCAHSSHLSCIESLYSQEASIFSNQIFCQDVNIAQAYFSYIFVMNKVPLVSEDTYPSLDFGFGLIK